MKEKPILFSGVMVKAILDGRKFQTRRVMKNQPIVAYRMGRVEQFCSTGYPQDSRGYTREQLAAFCPYGEIGSRLWVRETFAVHKYYDGRPGNGCGPIPEGVAVECQESPDAVRVLPGLMHRTIGNKAPDERGKWRPSIFMPRWASRITLEITDIRVKRLQEISESDARAEGVPAAWGPNNPPFGYRQSFEAGWDTINGKRPGCTWADNPFVWVIEFKPAPPQQPERK